MLMLCSFLCVVEYMYIIYIYIHFIDNIILIHTDDVINALIQYEYVLPV